MTCIKELEDSFHSKACINITCYHRFIAMFIFYFIFKKYLHIQILKLQYTVSFHSEEPSWDWPPILVHLHLYPFSPSSSPLSRYQVLPSSFVPDSLTFSFNKLIPQSFSFAIPVSVRNQWTQTDINTLACHDWPLENIYRRPSVMFPAKQ